MNPTLKNILAVVAGLILGGIINMGIVMMSGSVIAPPAGSNLTTMEGIKAALPLFEPKHFLMPFLAHAIGTFVGALITARFAATRKMQLALLIGFCYLIGGIENFRELPESPTWFIVVDLVVAYIPMGYLGGKLMLAKK